MRRILSTAVPLAIAVLAVLLLRVRLETEPVLSLQPDAQIVSERGGSAVLRAELGPGADRSSFRATLNGEDVTRRFRFAGAQASAHVDDLRPGGNDLVVSVRDDRDRPHRRELHLAAGGDPPPSDLTAELRETARSIMAARQAARRDPGSPARLLALAERGVAAIDRMDLASRTARAAEGDAVLLADLTGTADARVSALRDHYAATRRRLRALGLEDKLERLGEVEETAVRSAQEIADALRDASSGDPDRRRGARDRIERLTRAPEPPLPLPRADGPPPPRPDDQSPLDLYHRAVSGEAMAGRDPATLLDESVPQLGSREPSRLSVGTPVAHAQSNDPDLQPGTGVRFDLADPEDPIVQQAAALGNDPVEIYEFVHNEIEFELYAGMARGARATLQARRGNSVDQAALLVALLRVSGYKARFVMGDILVDVDRAMSWLNVPSVEGATRLLTVGLFAPTVQTDGGEDVIYIQDTFWVKALVRYGPDRGRSLDAPLRWVLLDPSVKTHATRPGIDLPLVPFDLGTGSGGFLGSISLRTPIELWADAVRDTLRASHPDKTLDDMGVRGPIERVELDMLPPTLPYRPVQFHAEFADVEELPSASSGDVEPHDLMARRVILDLRQADDTVVLRHEVRAADFAHRRITVGWQGATPADQTLIDEDCNGDVSLCPDPALVDVVPVVRHEGADVFTGAVPVTLGDTLRVVMARVDSLQFILCFAQSGGDPNHYLFTDPCYYDEKSGLVVGGRMSLAIEVGQGSQPLIDERTERLVSAYQDVGLEHPGETGFPLTEAEWDDLVGELLYIGTLRYSQRHVAMADRVEDIQKYWSQPEGLGQTQSLVGVGFLSGTPVSIVPAGLLIDIRSLVAGACIRAVEDTARRDQAFQLLGYTSSAMEHQLWEELTQFESVSAVKGLQWVQDNPGFGATLVTLDSPSDPIPSVLPASIRAEIQQELDAGKTVIVPDRTLTIELWSGVVFVAERLGTQPDASFIIGTTGFADGGIAFASFPLLFNPPIYNGIGASSDLVRILDPINVASGNVDHSRTDVEMATRGTRPVRLERTYNSQLQEVGPFGFGWTHSYHWYLEAIDDDADGTPDEPEDEDGQVSGLSVVDGRGAVRRFAITSGNPASGTFAPEPGHHLHLANVGAVLELREPDGTVRTFAGFGSTPPLGTRARLESVSDPAGNTTGLQYSGGLLAGVVDPLGRTLSFHYDASDRVERVDDWSGRSWTYLYAGDDLVEVRDPIDAPLGRATERYEYYSQQLAPENDHNLKRHEDANGNGVTFFYYQSDKAYKQVDDEGGETRLSYDVFRLETVEVAAAGRRQVYQYDANGSLKRLVRRNGSVEDYVYDATTRNLLSTSDAFGHATQYAYDAFGNVKSVQTPSGATESFVYWYEENPGAPVNSPRHNKVVERTDARGTVFRFDYDARGLVTLESVTMDVGGTPTVVELRALEYDAFGNLTRRIGNIDPATPAIDAATDRVIDFVYDAQGSRLLETRTSLGGVTRNVWDVDLGEPDRGLLRQVRRERQATYPDGTQQRTTLASTTSYDVLGRVASTVDALGTTRTRVRDPGGRVIQRTVEGRDAEGALVSRTTLIAYDRADRTIQVTDPVGGVTRSEYDRLGNLVKKIDANGHATRFVHDASGDVVRRIDALGGETRFVRDAKGRVLEVIDPLGNVAQRTYDVEDRVISQIDPEGNKTTFAYDEGGNRIGTTSPRANAGAIATNADGFSETREYDELDRLVLVRDAIDGETRLELDLLGNPTSIRDAEGQETLQAFDREGRMTSRTDPLGRVETRTYDTLGNLIAAEDPKGQTADLFYDLENREVSAVYSDGSEIAFGFDGFGNATLERSPAVTYVTSYDALDRPVARIDSRFESAQRFTWDAAGNLLGLTDLEGGVTQYRYDELGRIVGISTPDGIEVERHYDAAGRLVAQHWDSGASASYTYTPAGRLDRIEHWSGLGALLASRDYDHDANGNRTEALLEGGGVEQYAYDALDRLTGATYADLSQQAFAYDGVGNRTYENDRGTERWLQHDAANRLLSIASDPAGTNILWSFAYDANGNPTSRTTPDLSGWITYTWDVRDRLVEVQDAATGQTWTHAYDARGRRVAQTAPEKDCAYTWAGDNRVGAYAAGSQVARFTYGAALDDAIHVDHEGTRAHIHADALGTVLSASSAAGVELASYEYDAFGALRTASGTFENDLAFTGRVRDTSGLLYYRARFYDPGLGRFLNPDPIRFEGGINFYAYAGNNPTTLTDPTGEVALAALVGIGAVAGGASAGISFVLETEDFDLRRDFGGLAKASASGAAAGALLGLGLPFEVGAAGALAFAGSVGAGANAVTQGFSRGFANIGLRQVATFGVASAFAAIPTVALNAASLSFIEVALIEAAQVPKAAAFDLLAGHLSPEDALTTGEVLDAGRRAFDSVSEFFGGGSEEMITPTAPPPLPTPPPIVACVKGSC